MMVTTRDTGSDNQIVQMMVTTRDTGSDNQSDSSDDGDNERHRFRQFG